MCVNMCTMKKCSIDIRLDVIQLDLRHRHIGYDGYLHSDDICDR
jgi:hypothetical protein